MTTITYKNIKTDFDILSKIVFEQFQICKDLFMEDTSRKESIEKAEDNEHLIDGMEVKLRSEVIRSIVLHSPKASDLRKIIAYYDITGYLERMADHIYNMIKVFSSINFESIIVKDYLSILKTVLSEVEQMAKDAIFATVCKDSNIANKVILMQDEVEKTKESFISSLISKSDIKDINIIIALNQIIMDIEAIGANATNISEAAIYVIEGIDIKHK